MECFVNKRLARFCVCPPASPPNPHRPLPSRYFVELFQFAAVVAAPLWGGACLCQLFARVVESNRGAILVVERSGWQRVSNLADFAVDRGWAIAMDERARERAFCQSRPDGAEAARLLKDEPQRPLSLAAPSCTCTPHLSRSEWDVSAPRSHMRGASTFYHTCGLWQAAMYRADGDIFPASQKVAGKICGFKIQVNAAFLGDPRLTKRRKSPAAVVFLFSFFF